MMKVYYEKGDTIIRNSMQEDVEFLNTKLRQSDVDEVWASHHHTPEEALKISITNALLCITAIKNGIPICIFGIHPDSILGNKATIWFLATDELKKHSKQFLRLSKGFISYFLEYYPLLYNFVDDRNRQSICWLKWCGANMNGAVTYGIEKMPFHYFEFRRQQ